jgi:hypothetical protein
MAQQLFAIDERATVDGALLQDESPRFRREVRIDQNAPQPVAILSRPDTVVAFLAQAGSDYLFLSRTSEVICEPNDMFSCFGRRCQNPSPCKWKKGSAMLPGRLKGRTRTITSDSSISQPKRFPLVPLPAALTDARLEPSRGQYVYPTQPHST